MVHKREEGSPWKADPADPDGLTRSYSANVGGPCDGDGKLHFVEEEKANEEQRMDNEAMRLMANEKPFAWIYAH